MSYPDILDVQDRPKSIENLLFRKEFSQLKIPPSTSGLNPSFLDDILNKEGKLFPHPQQQFVRNFINPNTKYKRLLCKHDTGTGKTFTSLLDAFEFIKYYKQQYNFTKGSVETPLVFIIGFSKAIFQRELLRRPEFGFISQEEIQEHKRLRYLSETGSLSDVDALLEFETKLKKRLTKKSRGGFFKFIGYKEFFNRLFVFSGETTSTESRVIQTEDIILQDIRAGNIVLNYDLIDAFSNSLIICDEIHNVYNSVEINNYGIALRTLFNIYDMPDEMDKICNLQGKTASGQKRLDIIKSSSLRIIFLTATPINNSPTEIVDLLNLLIPQSTLPGKKRLEKEDFFIDNRNLKKGALEKIRHLTIGYVSFLRNQNPKYFPMRILDGDAIKIPRKYLSERIYGYNDDILPYLKFTICAMSPLHYQTYKLVYKGTLPPDGQSLLDMIIPNPGISENIPKNIGLFRSKDIRYSIQNAPSKWKDEYQIDLIKQEGSNSIITGEFMRMPTLAKYSSKYAMMVNLLVENLKNNSGKILIIHQYVKMSGVLFIQEVLLRNGFLDESSNPTDDTLCSICGIRRKKHKPSQDHEFMPVRFITIYGEMDNLTKNRSIEKFSRPDDVDGKIYRIMLGSKVLNEGVDLTAIQNIWVMSVPSNIPTLLQILGRAIRDRSHISLPPEKRKVRVRIFVSSIPTSESKTDLSNEEYKYFEKLMDYLIVQQIEKVFNSNAIDSPLYRNIIFPNVKEASKMKAELGTLYFDISPIFGKKWEQIADNKKKLTTEDVNLTTFYPYYSWEEVQTISYIIKRLFIEQSTVWTYEDLWNSVRSPPFDIYVNPELFLENNFLMALSVLCPSMILESGFNISDVSLEQKKFTSRLFNSDDSKIIHKNRECQITKKDHYFMLLPIRDFNSIPREDDYSLLSLGFDSEISAGKPTVEVDSWYRRELSPRQISVRITESLKTSNISYNQMKYRFYNQFANIPIEEIPTTVELYDLDFHVHLVEDAIRYVFNIYTNSEIPFSELHEFYFKILYFYDRLEMILFADQLKDTKLFIHYSKYVESGSRIPFGIHDKSETGKKMLKEEHDYNSFLMSSISRSEGNRPFVIDRLNEFLGKRPSTPHKHKHPRLDDMNVDKLLINRNEKKIVKVFPNLLPVGHFLTTNIESSYTPQVSVPKIYIPENEGIKSVPLWKRAVEFISEINTPVEIENDILIGYYEKNPSGIDVKFKLRPPIQQIEYYEDSRMIERGSACNTRHKNDLLELAKSLNIKDISETEKFSIKDICTIIKLNLMKKEMSERRKWKHLSKKDREKTKRIRYFYLHFEKQQGE
jgi:hypothetical protein